MKRSWIIGLLVLSMLFVVGCQTQLPSGVKGALYTAQLSLEQTVADVADAETAPWVIPADATIEQKLALTEKQVIVLTKIMAQANKNLLTVAEYFRTGKPSDEK